MKKDKKTESSIDKKLERLAQSVAGGFAEVKSDMKTGFADVREEMKNGFVAVDKRFDEVDERLGVVERLLASNRIERLEDGMRQVKTLLKIG